MVNKSYSSPVAASFDDDDNLDASSLNSSTSSFNQAYSEDGDLSASFNILDSEEAARRKAEKEQAKLNEERLKMAGQEDRQVKCLRMIFFFTLLATAAMVCTGVFLQARNDQYDNFEREYENHAGKVVETFHASVERKLGAFDALSQQFTSHSIETGAVFPNVTLPHFEIHAAATRILSDGLFVYYTPIVTDEIRKEWEAYATANQGHLMPAFMNEYTLATVQDVQYGYAEMPEAPAGGAGIGTDQQPASDASDNSTRFLQLESIGDQSGFREEIWGDTGAGETEAPNTGPYTPIWQISAALPLINLLNFNNLDLDFFTGPYLNVMGTGKCSLGPISNLDDANDENGEAVKVFNGFIGRSQYRHELDQYVAEPLTTIAFPVFDQFNPMTRQVKAILSTAIYWRVIFTNVLNPSAKGILAVLENSLGQFETYRIDGEVATYVGKGDLHDKEFDYLEMSTDVTDYVNSLGDVVTRSYTAADLSDDFISYTLHIYPSSTTEDEYVTNAPKIFAIVIASVFLFTSCIFLLYDWIVERRQNKVLSKAVKSTAIVKALFPENVHKRMYGEDESVDPDKPLVRKGSVIKDSNNNKWKVNEKRATKVTDFLQGNELSSPSPSNNPKQKSKPIADLFPDCTVFFADLAGFTSWSSKRQPTEVFELLETLYGAFDAIANYRNVFKVETIGDCYVAVTGLPSPQPDHAMIMVKFARSCLKKMALLLEELKEELGEDTGDLEMRIGLHSGPVTAGVLRGEKSRFQLFGDTVNTASRMESNGVKGRIHCSQSTADELIMAGKKSWITAREGTITAKGKGEMQTYFISNTDPRTDKSRRGSTRGSSSADFSSHHSTSEEEEDEIMSEIRRSGSIQQEPAAGK